MRPAQTPALNEDWREKMRKGLQLLQEETWVARNDAHYDAKVLVAFHPYGTGSLLSELGSGQPQALARNRLTLIDSQFRRSPHYGFLMYNRVNESNLFFKQKKRREQMPHEASAAEKTDNVTRLFGEKQPADLPETSTWWKHQPTQFH